MRTVLPLALALALPLALAAPAAAGHAPPRCPPYHTVEVTGGTADTTYYVVYDEELAFGNGVWIYMETNGIWNPKPAGVYFDEETEGDLQRGGSSPYIPDDAEICIDDPIVPPDMLVF